MSDEPPPDKSGRKPSAASEQVHKEALPRLKEGRVAEGQVADYLVRHPDFLTRHPEVLKKLKVPGRFSERFSEQSASHSDDAPSEHDDLASGEGDQAVLDLQQFVVGRLQKDLESSRRDQQKLAQSVRESHAFQARIIGAVQALLSAPSFEDFIHRLTHEAGMHLKLDAVVLNMEAADLAVPGLKTSGVQLLPYGYVDAVLGPKNKLLIDDEPTPDPALFGAAVGLVRSQALLRLAISPKAPAGLLALGSRLPKAFEHPAHHQALLLFFAQAVQHLFRTWLHLPPED